jgi:hypothetical protein
VKTTNTGTNNMTIKEISKEYTWHVHDSTLPDIRESFTAKVISNDPGYGGGRDTNIQFVGNDKEYHIHFLADTRKVKKIHEVGRYDKTKRTDIVSVPIKCSNLNTLGELKRCCGKEDQRYAELLDAFTKSLNAIRYCS